VPGCKGFDDLRRYNGVLHETYQQACLARGLLEDDQEWDDCLQQASLTQSGKHLRTLFCVILQFNNPSNPAFL
jgi:hypothetical protein